MMATNKESDISAGQPGKRKALPGGVARQIEGWVRSERFGPGGRLPSERELAVRIGTSRNVIREALRILETRGVVEVRHGTGTFAAHNLADAEPRIPVKFDMRAEELPVSEILVARRAIECAVVAVAARACDNFDLSELRRLIEVAVRAIEADDRAKFVEADLGFHEALGISTHNSLLRQVQLEITRATQAVRGIASATRDGMQAAVQFHREIADACAKGDEEAARAVMLLHLIDAAERTLGGARGGVPDEKDEDREREGEKSRGTSPGRISTSENGPAEDQQ